MKPVPQQHITGKVEVRLELIWRKTWPFKKQYGIKVTWPDGKVMTRFLSTKDSWLVGFNIQA